MEDFVVSAQSNERVGAYIIDAEGNAVPDLSDEAMAARQKKLSNDNPPPAPPRAGDN